MFPIHSAHRPIRFGYALILWHGAGRHRTTLGNDLVTKQFESNVCSNLAGGNTRTFFFLFFKFYVWSISVIVGDKIAPNVTLRGLV